MFVPFNPTFSCDVPLSAMSKPVLEAGLRLLWCKLQNKPIEIHLYSFRHISKYVKQQVHAYSIIL